MKFSAKLICVFLTTTMIVTGVANAKKKETRFEASISKLTPDKQIKLKKTWSRSLKVGSSKKRYYPEQSDLLLLDKTLYVGTHGGSVYAVSVETGSVLWEKRVAHPVASKMIGNDSVVIYSDLEGNLVALDKNDGAEMWRYQVKSEMLGRPALQGERLYVLTDEDEVSALSVKSGHVLWKNSLKTYFKNLTMRGQSSITMSGDALYVGLANGHIYKMSASNGSVLWDVSLVQPFSNFKDIDSQPALIDGSLYVGGYGNKVAKLDTSGKIIWEASYITGNDVAGEGDFIYVTTLDNQLVALDKKDGTQKWFAKIDQKGLSAPVVLGQYVFVATHDKGYLMAFDKNTGSMAGKTSLSGGSLNNIMTSDSDLIVFSGSGQVSRWHFEP